MTTNFSIEPSFKIFDNNSGTHVNVGNDPDGLDLCRISYHDPDATNTPEIFVERDMIPYLIRALKLWHAQSEQD